MKIGELAQRIHVHRVHAWRLAKSRVVPGTKRTKGGHFYFVECSSLTRWINFMKAGGAFRRKEMKRAYQSEYGKVTPDQHKAEMVMRKAWRDSNKNRRSPYRHFIDNRDLFVALYSYTDSVIQALEELTKWRECKLKSDLIRTSRGRLEVLRQLIDTWVSSGPA